MRIRIIPENSKEVRREGIDAVVYVESGFKAKAYTGKSNKRAFYFRFRSEAEMNAHIENYFSNLAAKNKEKQERKAASAEYKTSLVPGDILYSSWGYDQTNIDFYQVVEVSASKKSVKIREIGYTEEYNSVQMSGKKMPVPGKFTGEVMNKKVKGGRGLSEYISLNSFSSAWKWDGTPKSFSTYA